MTAPDARQPDQKPTSPSAAPTDSSSDAIDDEAVQRALEAVEASADEVIDEAELADEDMFASIESFIDDLEERGDDAKLPSGPEETAATPDSSGAVGEPQDASDDAFAQTMAALGDDAMAAPAEVEAEMNESFSAPAVADVVDEAAPTSDASEPEPEPEPESESESEAEAEIEAPAPIDRPDVALDASSEPEAPPADLTLDDEIANQLDDLFQTDLNDLDEVLNDVFGPEGDGERETGDREHRTAATAANSKEATKPVAKPKSPPTATPAAAPVDEDPEDNPADTSSAADIDDAGETDDALAGLDDDSTFSAPAQESSPASGETPVVNAAPRAPAAPKQPAAQAAAARSTASVEDDAGGPSAQTAPAPMVINASRPSAEVDAKMESPLSEAIRQILVMVNGPVRSMPESKRTLVNWFALTLAMWVPIVWAAVWFLSAPE